MIPVLYPSSEMEFKNNGIGRLSDCLRCIVTEERNGIYECELDYPVTGIHYSDISEGCIIFCIHDDKKKPQPFEIYEREAPIDGVVTFRAHHISYRLGNALLKPFRASSLPQVFAMLPNQVITENPFTFWTDKTTTGEYRITVPVSIKEMLGGTEGSILDIYGTGEYEWDTWTVKLYLHRGEDTPVQIRYGKNLSDIVYERSYLEQYTAVAPYWEDRNTGETVMLPEYIVYADEVPTETDALLEERGDTLITEAGENLEAVTQIIKPVPLDLSDRFDRRPTEAQLRTQAQRAHADATAPKINIKVEFAQMWQTPEYEQYAPLQRVSLCDRVSIYYPDLGIIAHSQQVIRVVYDVLLERYESMELGAARTSFADSIRATVEEGVLKKVPSTSFLEASISRATELIKGGQGGHIVIGTDADGKPNEIYAMDTDDTATAMQVIRINKNGIGFSTNGIEGPYRSAWTIDGHFVADFIDTGTLQANLLRTGIISDRLGKNYWNLDTGEFSISLEPGEEGEVTQADLARVENNARQYASNAEANANSYTDGRGFLTEVQVDNKIQASAAGLESRFSTEYSAKGDTTTNIVPYYYKSKSPTALFGGQWTTTAPAWEEGWYIWQKERYIKGDNTYTESDPRCTTGNTGKGADGTDGSDALNLYWTADNVLSTPKEVIISVTLTAHVGQGDIDDIDPNGIVYDYIWYVSKDNGPAEICGRGKHLPVTIDGYLCNDRADIWFGLSDDPTMFYLLDADGVEIEDHEENPLEVA